MVSRGMGMTFSWPFANSKEFDNQFEFESYLARSISFEGEDAKILGSVSFSGQDSKPCRLKSFGSGKMILEGSLSFKGRELEAKISLQAQGLNAEDQTMIRSISFRSINAPDRSAVAETTTPIPLMGFDSNRHQAALKLQKTYKSFRTRRQLADCAVLVEQRWYYPLVLLAHFIVRINPFVLQYDIYLSIILELIFIVFSV